MSTDTVERRRRQRRRPTRRAVQHRPRRGMHAWPLVAWVKYVHLMETYVRVALSAHARPDPISREI
jgi:hypothetical protein